MSKDPHLVMGGLLGGQVPRLLRYHRVRGRECTHMCSSLSPSKKATRIQSWGRHMRSLIPITPKLISIHYIKFIHILIPQNGD